MSLPVPGDYYIVNSIASSVDWSRLAIQFNGNGAALTIEPLQTSNTNHIWIISDYDDSTQTVSPKADPSLQVAFGNGYLRTLDAGAYTWTIREGKNGNYTFQDGGRTVYWGVDAAEPEEQVVYYSEDVCPTEKWWLYHA